AADVRRPDDVGAQVVDAGAAAGVPRPRGADGDDGVGPDQVAAGGAQDVLFAQPPAQPRQGVGEIDGDEDREQAGEGHAGGGGPTARRGAARQGVAQGQRHGDGGGEVQGQLGQVVAVVHLRLQPAAYVEDDEQDVRRRRQGQGPGGAEQQQGQAE